MANLFIKTKKVILLIGDILCLYLALFLTLAIRYGFNDISKEWSNHFWPFTVVFVLWLVALFISDFYDLKSSFNTSKLLSSLIKVFIAGGIIAIVIFYFLSPFFDSAIKPQRVLLIDLVIAYALIFAWRKFFFNFIKSTKILNNVLIIGKSPLSDLLVKEIKARPQLGYGVAEREIMPENLKDYCVSDKVDVIVNALDSSDSSTVSQKLFDCLSLGIDVYNISGFYEQITNKIPVEYIKHEWFLENLSENSKKTYEVAKRFLDIVFSSIMLVIAAIFIPFIALIIKLESPGSVFFKQIRTGKGGKDFLAIKFRSMLTDAEKNGPQWAQKNDSRVTRFGKLMRKTRIDEIPQLINIFKGEMSFVGPRPERPEFIEILSQEIPFYKERLLARPGLTGWAQLRGPSYGGSKEESLEKLKYDLYYIKNRSLMLDISIILKTINIVLSGKGQ